MNKVTKLYKALKEGLIDFNDSHDIYTPASLVNEALSHIPLKGNILVMFNIEFVISLVYNHNVDPDRITFYSDHINKTRMAEHLGINKYITKLGTNMKFDVVVGNPPYKQGLWRTLMKQALEISNRYVVMVSPDGTIKTSTKYNEMKSMLEEGGIQSVTPCQKFFENEGVDVITSSEICYYVFDKSKLANPKVFNKTLTKEEQLTLNIISKIKLLGTTYGTLTESGSIGVKDKTAIGSASVLKRITQSGPVYENTPKNKARYLEDAKEYFFVNKFFGMNPDDLIYDPSGPLYFTQDNIYSIGNIKGLTVVEFKRIYLHKLMRFTLAYYRGTNTRCLGWSIRELPKISASTTDLYKLANLTEEEISYVESTIK